MPRKFTAAPTVRQTPSTENLQEPPRFIVYPDGIIEAVEYRDIPEFPGYKAGDNGWIWSSLRSKRHGNRPDEWHIRKPTLVYGYPSTNIKRHDGRYVLRHDSRLVLSAFKGPGGDMEACHRDGNPLNSRLDNLRWGDHLSNEADKVLHGTLLRGERNPFARLSADKIKQIREERQAGLLHREIASIHGISRQYVGDILNGKNWNHV